MTKNVTKGNLWGYIQSRPYASVADIRRQFSLETDVATPIRLLRSVAVVGLPRDGAQLIQQLVREGRVSLDLLPDIRAPVVNGVYAIRVTNQGATAVGAAKGRGTRKRNRRSAPLGSNTPSNPPAPEQARLASDNGLTVQ